MTEKQEKILSTALELFAKEGFSATSTSRVAKVAGVSEGLIFRHFTNKEGLLKAILELGEERAKLLFADIVLETNPKQIILKTIALGKSITITQETTDFWKLQYKIKWETENYSEQKMIPLYTVLCKAFTELNYANPEKEASNLLMTLDGMAMQFFLQKQFNLDDAISFLKSKYEI